MFLEFQEGGRLEERTEGCDAYRLDRCDYDAVKRRGKRADEI